MFPLKSGLDTTQTPDPTQVFYQSVTASAMHEIGQQAIQDVSLLMFHQLAAEVYYRRDETIEIPTGDDGKFVIYTPAEEAEIKTHLINVVMKFHILDESGLGNRLTPLINKLYGDEPIPADLQSDPFLNAVLAGQGNFSQHFYAGSMSKVMEQILDFAVIVNRSLEEDTQKIMSSYREQDDTVPVAIYEDGNVQCVCEFCEGFFQILDNEQVNFEALNSLQKIMAQKYSLV